MKKIAWLVLGVVMSLAATSAYSAEKMVVMDYQSVLFSSIAAQEATNVLRERMAQPEARLRELEQGFQARQSRLQTDEAILTEDELGALRGEMQRMLAERQQLAGQLQQAQQTSRNEFVQQHRPLLQSIVKTYVEENDIDVVFETQSIIWNSALEDITVDITALFNEQYQQGQ